MTMLLPLYSISALITSSQANSDVPWMVACSHDLLVYRSRDPMDNPACPYMVVVVRVENPAGHRNL